MDVSWVLFGLVGGNKLTYTVVVMQRIGVQSKPQGALHPHYFGGLDWRRNENKILLCGVLR